MALDGVFLFETAALADFNWHSFSFDYTATSTSAFLSLEAQINGTDYAYFIDNISIEAVPEPNSLWLDWDRRNCKRNVVQESQKHSVTVWSRINW